MSTPSRALAPVADDAASIMERVITTGDLAALTPAERVTYYAETCRSLGLNPLTQPLAYLRLNGKLVLYATKNCTDQLRSLREVSIRALRTEQMGDVYVVTAEAAMPGGRTDIDSGAVSTKGLQGDALANAIMKALTKSKRRVTLSICGLGLLDETEIETIPHAQPVVVDRATGEITPDSSALPPGRGADAASDAQRREIFALVRERGLSNEDGKRLIHDWAGVGSTKDLTRDQAGRVIDTLTTLDGDDLAAEVLRLARTDTPDAPDHDLPDSAPTEDEAARIAWRERIEAADSDADWKALIAAAGDDPESWAALVQGAPTLSHLRRLRASAKQAERLTPLLVGWIEVRGSELAQRAEHWTA